MRLPLVESRLFARQMSNLQGSFMIRTETAVHDCCQMTMSFCFSCDTLLRKPVKLNRATSITVFRLKARKHTQPLHEHGVKRYFLLKPQLSGCLSRFKAKFKLPNSVTTDCSFSYFILRTGKYCF